MEIKIEKTSIPDVLVVSHQVFNDDRGFFMEVYRQDIFKEHGLPTNFVQSNHSSSQKNTIRGLHFQWEPPMGKLMRVSQGSAFVVAVDVRHGSPTLSKWFGIELTDNNRKQLWAPAGFARGFAVLSEQAEVQYLCTATYHQECESGIAYNDPDVGIEWPVSQPVLSQKDQDAMSLNTWLETSNSQHFKYNK